MHRAAVVLIVLAVVGGACGADGDTRGGSSRTTVTVFAAASLTEAFNDLRTSLAAKHPELRVSYSFAGSQALATQIRQGAPGDVFASADQRNMRELVDDGLVGTPRVFARNELEIAVAPGNPKHVTGLADLARADLSVVLEDPSVPAGSYSQQALRKAGVAVKPKSLELDVRSALARVTSGEADAAIVYVSDVTSAGARATGVAIPGDENVVATYPISVLRASKHRAAAQRFVDQVVSGAGQRALRARGFLPAS